MTPPHHFFRALGRFLAAAVTQRYHFGPTGDAPMSSGGPAGERWAALRKCWLDLLHPQEQQENPEGSPSLGDLGGLTPERQEAFANMVRRHREALDALVAAGELDAAVADGIAVAFDEDIAHREGSMSMCYIAIPAEAFTRQDLGQQLALLDEMAAQSDIDPATVEQARAALARDIKQLSQLQAGQVPASEGDLPEDASVGEAASILVELLLRR
jgi:hypothetical protein